MGSSSQGDYISLRDAGNILAGMNAKDHGQSFDAYMRGAGGYQAQDLLGAARGYFGATLGPPPYYGEERKTGRAIEFGYYLVWERKQ